MWARVHKLDRWKPLPAGGGIAVIEDERTAAQMQRVPSVSTLVAIARVLNAHRVLDLKAGGKGEVRYAASARLPAFLSEAIVRAGAAVTDATGTQVLVPAQPAGIAAQIDVAFSELAHHVRATVGGSDLGLVLSKLEGQRRAAPLDKDARPDAYWTAVLELAALAGEQARRRGGRWIDTRELPMPFAVKLADGSIAHPTTVAQMIVEGGAVGETLGAPESGPVE